MKKFLYTFIAAIVAFSSVASAQDLLRYNYKKNGYVYTGTERIRIPGTSTVEIKLDKVSLSAGAATYILHVYYESASPWKMPKNAPLSIRTADGTPIVSKNSFDDVNMIAPKGFRNDAGVTVYWNYGKYYYDEADIKKIADKGVSSIDATRRWSEDGHIKVTYKNNEFGKAIASQLDVLSKATAPKAELGDQLKAIDAQGSNVLVESKTVSVNGQLSVALVYLYYGSTNKESYDLNLYLPNKNIPLGAAVTVVTSDGKTINMQQEKDVQAGRVFCYPTNEELKAMVKGVSRLSVETDNGTVTLTFPGSTFSKTLGKLYNAIQRVAVL